MSKISKSGAQGVFAQAYAALGNYQDEKAKNPPASGPPGRNYPPSQQEQEYAKMEAAALKFIKGGMEKSAGAKGDPGTIFNSTDMTSGLAGMAKGATGMQATMMSMLGGAGQAGGGVRRAGGVSISLGAQFNMRMKTPNLARMRGSANAMSMVPRINNSSKIASMFSGGGGGNPVSSIMANAGSMGGKAAFGGAQGAGSGRHGTS